MGRNNHGIPARIGACFLACMASALLSGCAASLQQGGSALPDGSAALSADMFAETAAAMPAGSSALMATPFGQNAEVAAGEFYTSGLGEMCRHTLVAAGGMPQRVSVCKGRNGWYTATPIFEGRAR